jgi:HSP20 family protein
MAEKQEIARWNPFADLEGLTAFGAFRDFPRLPRILDEMFTAQNGGMPARFALDVTESDKEYAITAELPGVKKDDIAVECTNGVLEIRAEKKSEREEKKERGRVLERTYGSFSRSLRLPEDADLDQVKASFKDGLLRLEIAKRPEAKAKTIAIKS